MHIPTNRIPGLNRFAYGLPSTPIIYYRYDPLHSAKELRDKLNRLKGKPVEVTYHPGSSYRREVQVTGTLRNATVYNKLAEIEPYNLVRLRFKHKPTLWLVDGSTDAMRYEPDAAGLIYKVEAAQASRFIEKKLSK